MTPSEQIESTHEVYEAGCALVHIHVRNKDESPSPDPMRVRSVVRGIVERGDVHNAFAHSCGVGAPRP